MMSSAIDFTYPLYFDPVVIPPNADVDASSAEKNNTALPQGTAETKAMTVAESSLITRQPSADNTRTFSAVAHPPTQQSTTYSSNSYSFSERRTTTSSTHHRANNNNNFDAGGILIDCISNLFSCCNNTNGSSCDCSGCCCDCSGCGDCGDCGDSDGCGDCGDCGD